MFRFIPATSLDEIGIEKKGVKINKLRNRLLI